MTASVIIPSFRSRQTIERCLESLERQRRRAEMEILVSDSSDDGAAELIARRFPDVRLFHSKERMFPGRARNLAAKHAAADLIVFLDADCFVEPDWMDRVMEAHQCDDAAIGGAILNGNPQTRTSVAHYLFEFSAWLPADFPRDQVEIPGGCLSLERRVFERYGPFPEDGYSEDSVFCWRLREAGIRMRFTPSIRVFHTHASRFGPLVRAKATHGRWFAWNRAREYPAWKRIALAAGAPVLPLLLLWRISRRVRRSPEATGFGAAFPLIALLALAWSWGEFLGYVSRRIPYNT